MTDTTDMPGPENPAPIVPQVPLEVKKRIRDQASLAFMTAYDNLAELRALYHAPWTLETCLVPLPSPLEEAHAAVQAARDARCAIFAALPMPCRVCGGDTSDRGGEWTCAACDRAWYERYAPVEATV